MVMVYHSERIEIEREEVHWATPRRVHQVVLPAVLSWGSYGPRHLSQPGKLTRASVSEPVRGLGHVAMVDL